MKTNLVWIAAALAAWIAAAPAPAATVVVRGATVWTLPGFVSLTTGDIAGDAAGNSYLINGNPAAGGGSGHGSKIRLARVGRSVLDGESGLVGESTEVDLVGMGRGRQHGNVGARAEDPVQRRPDHDCPHRRMFQA